MSQNPEAHRASQARYYAANREKARASIARSNEKKRREIRDYITFYKEERGCEDCGVSYPHYVLDLDHRPGEEKVCTPTRLTNTCSWAKVHAELAKCDVVCSNCHRKRTHERLVHNESLHFDPDAV